MTSNTSWATQAVVLDVPKVSDKVLQAGFFQIPNSYSFPDCAFDW